MGPLVGPRVVDRKKNQGRQRYIPNKKYPQSFYALYILNNQHKEELLQTKSTHSNERRKAVVHCLG
jgi:hypothetical protein